MTRTVSAVYAAAVAQDTTTPVYLIRMAWATEQRICTWDSNIIFNAETWTASGASVDGLSADGGTLKLPNGDADPWMALVDTESPLDRAISVYEHHTSTASPAGSDAELLFSGRMDGARITKDGIQIEMIKGRNNSGFPPTSIGPPIYNYLLTAGTRLFWGPDVITVN